MKLGLTSLRIASALILAPLTGVQAQSGIDEIEIIPVKLTENLYMFQGGGGNIGVSIGADGVVLIDDKYASLTDRLRSMIREFTDQDVKFVINTHWHHDHTSGNESFSNEGATVVAHENARNRMVVEQVIVPPMTGGTAPALPKGGWPVVTFSENLTFYVNGREARAIHAPNAHTDGDAIIHLIDDNVIHMGDIFFNGAYPNIDVGSNGTIDGMIAAQELAIELAGTDTRIIPGHGDMADREDLAATVEMLKTVRTRVSTIIEQGMSEEEAVALAPLDDLDEVWGQGYIKAERMVRQAYKSIAGIAD